MSSKTSGNILTLQFGHYANFVGTHWWNIQEKSFSYSTNPEENQEINHDMLYREGINDKGQVTFTPRLLLVDLKGSLGAHPESSQLYDEEIDFSKIKVEWDPDKVEVMKSEKLEKNKYQQTLENQVEIEYNLENEVNVWADFSYARYHPRTLNIVNEYKHQEDSEFNFPMGEKLWKSEQFEDDFSDKVRNYVEECDYFQGFQILLDAIDGFSGLSTSSIECFYDEYNRSIAAFPLIPSYYSDYSFKNDEDKHQSLIKDSCRVLNLAFCYNALRENSSLFVPLCTGKNGWRQPGPKREFYHLNYNHEIYYHSAAILATALDTFSLKYRLKSNSYTLSDLITDLTAGGRKAAAASLCLPFSLNIDSELIECLDDWEGPLTQSITPNCNLGTDKMVQLYTLRGIPENRLKKPAAKAGTQNNLPAYQCTTIREMLQYYLSCSTFGTINNATVVNQALTVQTPFPKLFDKFVGYNGNIIASPRPDSIDVHSVPVMAALHNGSDIGGMLETLHTETKKIKFGKFHQFQSAGIEMDEFVECLDNLFEFRELYEDNYYL